MGYADLIRHLQTLPASRQAEVFELVAHLVQQNEAASASERTVAQSPLAKWIWNPVVLPGFKPMSRDENNAR